MSLRFEIIKAVNIYNSRNKNQSFDDNEERGKIFFLLFFPLLKVAKYITCKYINDE